MTSADTLKYPTAPFRSFVKSQKIGVVRSANQLSESGSTPYLRMDAITLDGQLNLHGVKRTFATDAERVEYGLEAGDFLFNTRNSRELVGKTAVFHGPQGCIYNNNILRVRFSEHLLSEYAVAFFRTRFAKNELDARKSGTTSVFAIYQKNLETLPVAVPPIALQANYVARIKKVRAIGQQNQVLQHQVGTLFSSLQEQVFSEEFR